MRRRKACHCPGGPPAFAVGLVGSILAIGGLFLGAAPVALAQGGGSVVNGCMEDVYDEFGQGGGLNCTANDVQVASVTDINITDDGCAFPGDTVTFDFTAQILLIAAERHDVGVFFATDGDVNGDGALTGQCSISTPPYAGTFTRPDTSTGSFVDLDTTTDDTMPSDDFGYCVDGSGNFEIDSDGFPQACNENADCNTAGGFTCQEHGDGITTPIQDICGDIDAPNGGVSAGGIWVDIQTITAVCIDSDGDGNLDLPNCTSWRQPGANDLCLSPRTAFPGAPSACRCDIGFNVPIKVPGQIIVDKVTLDFDGNPLPDDPTFFDLEFTDVPTGTLISAFSLTDASAPFESSNLDAGVYAVTEDVPSGWTLDSASCTNDNGTPNDTSDDITFAYTNGGNINLASGEIVTCTFNDKRDNPCIDVDCSAFSGPCGTASCDPNGAPDNCEIVVFQPNTTECRASQGVCDVAESCTGDSVLCPDDGFKTATTECRASAGVCDVAESCPGDGPACPADGFLAETTECRAPAGVCDVAESCPGDGPACPADGFLPSTTECRASTHACDPAESCPGDGADCPPDSIELLPTLTVTKFLTNDDGGNVPISDFVIDLDATQDGQAFMTSFTGDQTPIEFTLDPQPYTVSEDLAALGLANFYAVSFSGDCAGDGTGTLACGDTDSCDVTNDDIAAQGPSINVTANPFVFVEPILTGSCTVMKDDDVDDPSILISDINVFVEYRQKGKGGGTWVAVGTCETDPEAPVAFVTSIDISYSCSDVDLPNNAKNVRATCEIQIFGRDRTFSDSLTPES
jgi:hypothetical protein